jgi:hypothetical protein
VGETRLKPTMLLTLWGEFRLWLENNKMDSFPAELCGLFPNVKCLFLDNNNICTLSREIGQLTRLEL